MTRMCAILALMLALAAPPLQAQETLGDWAAALAGEELDAAALLDGPPAVQGPELAPLAGYLTAAGLGNPEMEAAFQRFLAAMEKGAQLSALPDPRFTFAWFFQSVETRVGPQRARFGLAQTFPWLSKLSLRGQGSRREAEGLKARYDGLKSVLFARVKEAYFEYAYLAQAVRVTQESQALLRFLEGVVLERYGVGLAPYAAVVDLQVQSARLADRLRTQTDQRRVFSARLRAAMGESAVLEAEPLPWPESLPLLRLAAGRDDLLALSAAGNPELRAARSQVRRETANLELARQEYIPDVTLGVEYTATDESRASGPARPFDSGKDPVAGTVSINLPIWFGKVEAAKREAQARRTAALREGQGLANRLQADLEAALFKVQDAERRHALYAATLLPQAEQALEVNLEAYRAGARGAKDLVDAAQNLLEFDLARWRARADLGIGLAELERLCGQAVPAEIVAQPTGPAPAKPKENTP